MNGICIFRESAWRISQGQDGQAFVEGRKEGNCDCMQSECAMWEENTGKCGLIAAGYLAGWNQARKEEHG